MIDINVTLFFQVAHFLIAYGLLRKFLWRPAIDEIDRQNAYEKYLDDDLHKQQELIAQKEFELNKLWRHARSSFLMNTPAQLFHPAVIHQYLHSAIGMTVATKGFYPLLIGSHNRSPFFSILEIIWFK